MILHLETDMSDRRRQKVVKLNLTLIIQTFGGAFSKLCRHLRSFWFELIIERDAFCCFLAKNITPSRIGSKEKEKREKLKRKQLRRKSRCLAFRILCPSGKSHSHAGLAGPKWHSVDFCGAPFFAFFLSFSLPLPNFSVSLFVDQFQFQF